jgi:hypothetical protein
MSKQQPEEHRRFTRVPFVAQARLHTADNEWPCELLDVSLRGALIRRPATWPARKGEAVELALEIADGVSIRMQATVVHIEAERAGFACHHLDLDSAAHLRRLIELNLGDEAQLHRELASMIERPLH